MPTIRRIARAPLLAASIALLANPFAALAEEGSPSPQQQEIDRLTLANDAREQTLRRLELKNKIVEQRVKRITDLGLPEYEGTAKLEDGAGAMEITLLASAALNQAAALLADAQTSSIQTNDLIVAKGETLPRSELAALDAGLDKLSLALSAVKQLPECDSTGKQGQKFVAAMFSLSAVTAAITAVAGMFRSEITYSAVGAPSADAGLLADLMAIHGKAKRIDMPLPAVERIDGPAARLREKLRKMEALRDEAKALVAKLEAKPKPTESDKKCKAEATKVLAPADGFSSAWTDLGEDGDSRFEQAARFLALTDGSKGIVEVDVQAGGTAINTKNIVTFFGGDPLKLVADVVVTWRRYAFDGHALKPTPTGGMIACASRPMRMAAIRTFVRAAGVTPETFGPDIECRKIGPSPS